MIPWSSVYSLAPRRDKARLCARAFAGTYLSAAWRSDAFSIVTTLPAGGRHLRGQALRSRFLALSTKLTTPKPPFQLHNPSAAPPASF